MDASEESLLTMPVLVLEKILANIQKHSIVSLTCKYLYEIVCGMEKGRRVIVIRASDPKSPLNIDDDAVFDSIMHTHRTIQNIEVLLGRFANKVFPLYELNARQLERMTAIMNHFGGNLTSLKLHGFVLPIDFILEWLQQGTKLESLSFTHGKVLGSVPENATKSIDLPSFKELEVDHFAGLSDIVNLIPAGSLKSIRYNDESTDVLTTILAKQHNIKSLTLEISDLTLLCVNHLQLESLTFKLNGSENSSQLVKLLKSQTNLKILRFRDNFKLNGSSFQWICNNLRKLEVFEVLGVDPIEGNAFEMLGELTKLRHFRTFGADYLFANGFQSCQFKSYSIETFEFGFRPLFSCGELLTKMVKSMAHNLPNLTHLKMNFKNFSALCFLLSHCTKIIHLTSDVEDPILDQLTQQRFPNIQHLHLSNREMMTQSLTSIVRAMPNLKSLSLFYGLKFDVKAMKEFIKESRCLKCLFAPRFELHPELSTDDTVETIRCLMDQLEECFIFFYPSTTPEDLNWHKIKDLLSNDFYFLDLNGSFCLQMVRRSILRQIFNRIV